MKTIFLILLVLSLTSCFKDKYHSFSEEDRLFIVYKQDNKANFKTETDEIVQLQIDMVQSGFANANAGGISSFGIKEFEEYNKVKASLNNKTLNLDYFIQEDKFYFTLGFGFGGSYYSFEHPKHLQKINSSLVINDKTYEQIYEYQIEVANNKAYLFYNKEFGVLKLEFADKGFSFLEFIKK